MSYLLRRSNRSFIPYWLLATKQAHIRRSDSGARFCVQVLRPAMALERSKPRATLALANSRFVRGGKRLIEQSQHREGEVEEEAANRGQMRCLNAVREEAIHANKSTIVLHV